MKLCLWFDTQAEAAAAFYVETFTACGRAASVRHVSRHGAGSEREGQALVVAFTLDGQDMMALNGGPHFTFTPAASLVVDCADQAELDGFWDRLIADGGAPSRCGWLRDRFGFSWQIIPAGLPAWIGGPDAAGRDRAMAAMMKMNKLDIATLRTAYEGG